MSAEIPAYDAVKGSAMTASRDEQNARHTILTFPCGHYINPFDPDPAHIEIRDIAHALALTSRYAGHSPEPVSVAEHCVRVSRRMSTKPHYSAPEFAMAALLHDAEEAYFLDMPSPIKSHPSMAPYKAAAQNMRRAIFSKFGVPYDLLQHVKWADHEEYYRERREIWTESKREYIAPCPWSLAETLFLIRFERLRAQISGAVGI